jgi:diketogulonate reductase-like aldo/keto reductase
MSNYTFQPAADGVDPSRVPYRTFASGAKIPAIGLGTFGSDNYTSDQIAAAVIGAAEVGFRHFDCASVYGNEDAIGKSLTALTQGGLPRQELWVTSKVWNDMHGKGQVIASCKKSLADLNLDYLDLFLVHWPFPNHHAKGVDVSSRDHNARPYLHDDYMEVWAQMEQLYDEGLVRHIGTSNMTVPKLELVLRDARIKPMANELELHPHFQQPELYQYIVDHGIVPIGYSPIGSPSRPERDRTPDDTVDVEDPVIVAIAERLKVHPAVVCVKWAQQRGQIPIPFSVKRPQYLAHIQALVSEPLTDDEMAAISRIDKNNRLIKGHVFLWKDDQTWEALWDEGGVIPGW